MRDDELLKIRTFLREFTLAPSEKILKIESICPDVYVTLKFNGVQITAFYDAGCFDYIDEIIFEDGQVLTYENLNDPNNQDLYDLISEFENGQGADKFDEVIETRA